MPHDRVCNMRLMDRFCRSIQRRVSVPSVCGIALLLVGAVTCSPPPDAGMSQPMAVAAPSAVQSVGEFGGISAQPFVAIAKQARASVCQHFFGEEGQCEEQPLSKPVLRGSFLRRFFGEESDRRMPAHVNSGSRALFGSAENATGLVGIRRRFGSAAAMPSERGGLR